MISLSLYDKVYEEVPAWDIGREQGAFRRLVNNNNSENSLFVDPILDVGCGTGENSLFFAQLAFNVTGIDSSQTAIAKAIEKASDRNLVENVTFLKYNLFDLYNLGRTFNTIIDSGVFNLFDANSKVEYQYIMKRILNPKGKLIILSFNNLDPAKENLPKKTKEEDFFKLFKYGWNVKKVQVDVFEHNYETKCAPAWLAIIEKL